MKKITFAAAALFLLGFAAGIAQAQSLLVPRGYSAKAQTAQAKSLFNYGDFFAKARVGYSVNQHLERATVIYAALQRFHDTAGLEIASLNLGYNASDKHPLAAIGLRLDNVIPKLWGGEWGKAHVTTAKLPAIEFGPYLSGWPVMKDNQVRFDVFYGFVFAVGFGE